MWNNRLIFLPCFTLCFCLGIVTAVYRRVPFLILCLAAFLFLALAVFFIKEDKKCPALLLCCAFLLGAMVLRNSQVLPDNHIAKIVPYKSDAVSLIGIVDNDPEQRDKRTSFVLRAEKLKINGEWIKTAGLVLVNVFQKNDFAYGDRLFLSGKLYRPFSFSKGFDYRNYLRAKGIYLILSVKKDSMVKQLDKNAGNPLKSFALRIRHKMKDAIVKNLSPFSAGILSAVILGERQNLPAYVRDTLVKAGTVHIIAISGLHLTIVVFIILIILKVLRMPKKARYLIAIFLLVVYCILTGARLPVVRATVMASILLFGCFLKREVNVYNSLSIAGLAILLVNPRQLFEASFQLSFISVTSIVYLSPKIKSIFPARLYKIPWLRFLILAFSVSFACWLGLLPLIAYYFRVLSPVTILANMIIVPYMSVIIAAGFTLGLSGILIPALAPLLAASNELFILILFRINSSLITIPGAYFRLPGIPFTYALFYYCLLISMVHLYKIPIITRIFGRKKRQKDL